MASHTENKKSHKALTAVLLLVMAIAAAMPLTSCQKTPVNGDLDGQWRLVEMTVGGEPQDVGKSTFWLISLHVAQFSRDNDMKTSARLIYDGGDTLTFDFPEKHYASYWKALQFFGIYTNPCTFRIDHLSRGTLVASSDKVTVRLEKF